MDRRLRDCCALQVEYLTMLYQHLVEATDRYQKKPLHEGNTALGHPHIPIKTCY